MDEKKNRGRRPGRDYPDNAPVRLPAGALMRIKAVLAPDERQSEFMRDSIMNEVEKREAAKDTKSVHNEIERVTEVQE